MNYKQKLISTIEDARKKRVSLDHDRDTFDSSWLTARAAVAVPVFDETAEHCRESGTGRVETNRGSIVMTIGLGGENHDLIMEPCRNQREVCFKSDLAGYREEPYRVEDLTRAIVEAKVLQFVQSLVLAEPQYGGIR